MLPEQKMAVEAVEWDLCSQGVRVEGWVHHVLFFGKRWFHYSLPMTLHLLGKTVHGGQVKLQISCDMSPRAILPRMKKSPFQQLYPKDKITAF